MKKLKVEEMKNIKGGVCLEMCQCICAFLDAGTGYDEAFNECKKILDL